MSNFPSVITSFPQTTPSSRLNNPSHSSLENLQSSTIGQIETIIGLDGDSSILGTIIGDLRSPDSSGGGHIQSANSGGTGQTSYFKGDILVGTSSSVLSKLAVGTNGYIPVADSNQAVGIRWATQSSILAANIESYKVGIAKLFNQDTYENYQIQYGAAAATFGWTSISTPTYSQTHLLVGSAQGVYRAMPINLATGAAYNWSTDTKIKILEWDATIVNDTSTARSVMGFTDDTTGEYNPSSNGQSHVSFATDASGNWLASTNHSAITITETAISKPTAGKHTFRIEWTPGVQALFYVDGVLVATNNTVANLPHSNNTYNIMLANGTSSTIISAVSSINLAMQK